MIHLIFDFETLSQDVQKAPIINCSCVIFDTTEFDKGLSYDDVLSDVVTLKLDVRSQVEAGYKIQKETLAFWETVSPEARKQLAPSKNDLTYSQFCDKFISYLDNHARIDYWWSRSNTFDPILLWRIFDSCDRGKELNERLKFWKVRDVRTWIDAKSDFSIRNDFVPIDKEEWSAKFKAHDSRHDVVGDVLRMQKIYQLERE